MTTLSARLHELPGVLGPIVAGRTYDQPVPETPADRVLWQDQVPRPERPLVELPADADTVVIGGGYAGLAAATTLAAAGQQVVVLERDPLGTGAHTRNGGLVIPELKARPA